MEKEVKSTSSVEEIVKYQEENPIKPITDFHSFRSQINEDLRFYEDEIKPFEVVDNSDNMIILEHPEQRHIMIWTFVYTPANEDKRSALYISFQLHCVWSDTTFKEWTYYAKDLENGMDVRFEDIYYEDICNDFLHFSTPTL